MKLETEPRITNGPNLFASLLDILRKIAQTVNGNDDAATTAARQAAPPSEIGLFASSAAPAGWLKANGATVSRTVYADLFAVIGTSFGVGNGTTTFHLPDLRGEFPRFLDDGRGVDAARSVGNFQGDAMRNLTGSIFPHGGGTATAIGGMDGVFTALGYRPAYNYGTTTAASQSYDQVYFNAANQVPTAAEFRPRNVALLACIKY